MSYVPFVELKQVPFKSYDEIPAITEEYVTVVAGEKNLRNIPLTDINDFLIGLYEFEKAKREEWEDGWVL